ncbi:MAG: TolB family protein [Gaiellaceae bacterium]
MSDMDARLGESLSALAPAGGGDWSDVVARSSALGSAQHRRRLLTIAIVFGAFLVCAGTTLAVGNQFFGWFRVSTPPGWFKVETEKSKAPATRGLIAYVAGETLFRPNKRPQRLAFQPTGGLNSNPLAIPSPDGRYVLYQTGISRRSSTPMLYVHDTIRSREKLLARSAQSAAWSKDGRIAYFKATGERYEPDRAYAGQIVVQTLEGEPTAWTRKAAEYQALAWARDELIVSVSGCQVQGCDKDAPDWGIYALSRSGRLRFLNLVTLSALSADGRYGLGGYGFRGSDQPPLGTVIVRIDTGRVVARLSLTPELRKLVPGGRAGVYIFYSASWRGSEIVGSVASTNPGGNVLATFKVSGRRIVPLETLHLPARLARQKKYYDIRVDDAFLAGRGNKWIVAAVSGESNPHSDLGTRGPDYFDSVVVCSRKKGRCALTQFVSCRYGKRFCLAARALSDFHDFEFKKLEAKQEYTFFDVLDNPSRPLANPRPGSVHLR